MTPRIGQFVFALTPFLALLVGCPKMPPPDPPKPPMGSCKDPEKPYVVEWNSDERSALERRAQSGVVVVHYEGCKLEPLEQCRVSTKYQWEKVTPKRDRIAIKNSDELWATVPIGAASLEGKLQESGELTIETLRVGAWKAMGPTDENALQGDCKRATHVVSLMAVGAFEMSAAAGRHVRGGASFAGASGGYDKEQSQKSLTQDGVFGACNGAAAGGPPADCGALIRLELSKIGPATHACRPDREDECRAECSHNDEVSCQRLAAILAAKSGPHQEAADLFRRGCDRGDPKACNNYGVMLVRGEGMKNDLVRARTIFSTACDAGVMEACSNAGSALNGDEYGSNRRVDPGADRRFRQACNANIGVACYAAGARMAEDGRTYLAPDSIALLTKSCELRYRHGCRELWIIYRQSDPARAKEMQKRACNYGFAGACGEGQAVAESAWEDLVLAPPP